MVDGLGGKGGADGELGGGTDSMLQRFNMLQSPAIGIFEKDPSTWMLLNNTNGLASLAFAIVKVIYLDVAVLHTGVCV